LIKPQKQDRQVQKPETRDRAKFSQKVLKILTQFGATADIGFRKAAGEAMFGFTQDLIQVGDSVPRKVHQIANLGDLPDWFFEKAIRTAVIEKAD
jgi:hypothetical protein